MEPDFGPWQTPDISRSHLYRGTIAWTPPTAIYLAYTVLKFNDNLAKHGLISSVTWATLVLIRVPSLVGWQQIGCLENVIKHQMEEENFHHYDSKKNPHNYSSIEEFMAQVFFFLTLISLLEASSQEVICSTWMPAMRGNSGSYVSSDAETNDWYFTDHSSKYIFLTENLSVLNKISWKFVWV